VNRIPAILQFKRKQFKRNEKFGYCGLDIAPVNKLVFLTWLLWALGSFQRFTFTFKDEAELEIFVAF